MTQNELSEAIIGAAIEVHRALGPGLIEKAYEEALCHELHLRDLKFARRRPVPISYKGVKLSADLWLDLLIDEKVIVDLKAKETVTPLHKSKMLTYLRRSDLRLGLIINFHVRRLTDGVTRVANGFIESDEPFDPPDLRG